MNVPVEAILAEVLTPRAFRQWLAQQEDYSHHSCHLALGAYVEQFVAPLHVTHPTIWQLAIGAHDAHMLPAHTRIDLPQWAVDFNWQRYRERCHNIWAQLPLTTTELLSSFDAAVPVQVRS